jgi:hypothetical protein
MTHVILKIRGQLTFDGNARLLNKTELEGLMFETHAKEVDHRILVEITVSEEIDPYITEAGEKKK